MSIFKLATLIISIILLLIGIYEGITKENYTKGTFFISLSIIECLLFLVTIAVTT